MIMGAYILLNLNNKISDSIYNLVALVMMVTCPCDGEGIIDPAVRIMLMLF